jgi:hypothetical protein
MAVKVHQQPDNMPTQPIELTPFEQWVILRIREAKRDGLSAADSLRQLRDRCQSLQHREADLLSRLREISVLSRGLD